MCLEFRVSEPNRQMEPSINHRDGTFRTTHWSVVLAAANPQDPNAKEALAQLCQTYWCPLYVFIRRRGRNPEDAKDLTQEFILRLLSKNSLEGIQREGGRFRSFLLTALKRFLVNEWERVRAAKRGGGLAILSLDEAEAEAGCQADFADPAAPECTFDRRWAFTVLEQAMLRLRAEQSTSEKLRLFASLQPCLSGAVEPGTCKAIGESFDMSEGAVRTAIHRLRRRYSELLREEVGRMVAHPEELDDEIRYLIKVASR